MQGMPYRKCFLTIGLTAGLSILCPVVRGQELKPASASPAFPDAPADVRALSELVRDLRTQVQALSSQLGDLREEQERSRAEAIELRHQLELVKVQGGSGPSEPLNSYSTPPAKQLSPQPQLSPVSSEPEAQTQEQRIAKLEEDEQVLEGKVNDQYQTKVESGSKYRLRLSGIILLNMFENRGTVENVDFPFAANSRQSQEPNASPGQFGGTLRQSQIKLQAFGPDFLGARTSADLAMDFAGGFANAPNGAWMGLFRLRTGTVRLDWANTSIVAGQDRLFFAPNAPTSLATLATPALAYAGDLWAWTPQVRVERRVILSDASSFSFQAGILDDVTGDLPPDSYERYPSWGEQSGQPAYAVRISWSHRMFGEQFTIGTAGFYGRQDWGFSRNVEGWAGMGDLTLPLGKRMEFTGAFYRGRAVAGFGGGIGQSVLLNGPFSNPATTFRGLDSMGGWAQMKFKVKSNFEVNTALGIDNPFAGELRQFRQFTIYPNAFTRNLVPLVNFIYQIRSDILFSTEYRYFNSTVLDAGSNRASHINLSLGYIF